MGSLEDLFEREEFSWHSYQDAKYILSRHNKNSLTGPQDNLAVQLGEPYRLKDNIERTDKLDVLSGLKKEVEGLDITQARRQLTREVDNKIERIAREQREEVRRQELEIAGMTEIREREKQQRELRKAEMELAERIAREEERALSEDKRKRKNAQRNLKRLREE